jgi:hypothetical protein
MYFKVRRQVSCPIYYPAIYVPQKETPRCACNELLKVISVGESAGPTGGVAKMELRQGEDDIIFT